MTDTPFSTPAVNPSTHPLDAWLNEIEVAGGQCMPAKKLEQMLNSAPTDVKRSVEYHYWRGVLDAHQIHLFWGGVVA